MKLPLAEAKHRVRLGRPILVLEQGWDDFDRRLYRGGTNTIHNNREVRPHGRHSERPLTLGVLGESQSRSLFQAA